MSCSQVGFKTDSSCSSWLLVMSVTIHLHLYNDCVWVAGGVSVLELKRSSMMKRLSGWMPTAIRGEHSPADLVLSLAVRELEEDSFIFALCQDHKLRMWSFRVRNLLTFSANNHQTYIRHTAGLLAKPQQTEPKAIRSHHAKPLKQKLNAVIVLTH